VGESKLNCWGWFGLIIEFFIIKIDKMRETLITFETAKLAKEKGFNWGSKCYYSDGSFQDREKLDNYNHPMFIDGDDYLVSAPTQSLLQKWLREVHNLHIGVEPETFNSETDYISEIIMLPRNFLKYRGKTYEEALEIALKSALILIKDELVK